MSVGLGVVLHFSNADRVFSVFLTNIGAKTWLWYEKYWLTMRDACWGQAKDRSITALDLDGISVFGENIFLFQNANWKLCVFFRGFMPSCLDLTSRGLSMEPSPWIFLGFFFLRTVTQTLHIVKIIISAPTITHTLNLTREKMTLEFDACSNCLFIDKLSPAISMISFYLGTVLRPLSSKFKI